ncbi:MAG: hypothetical protein HC862_21665 [Scytonema sp. RU_4_4]|nr:hypothetical protein [Scytonema sp. RU_4_4]NJR75052.1 hypothetical protein [Scytonema sp. CRU_2_7]
MAKLTIDIPDGLVNQVTSAGYSLEAILLKALTQYLANGFPPQNITQTRTWQLCGRFAVSEAVSVSPLSEVSHPATITNDAEQVDDVLYQGF